MNSAVSKVFDEYRVCRLVHFPKNFELLNFIQIGPEALGIFQYVNKPFRKNISNRTSALLGW